MDNCNCGTVDEQSALQVIGRGFDSRYNWYYYGYNISGHCVALGLSQSLTRMSNRNVSVSEVAARQPYDISVLFFNLGHLNSWNRRVLPTSATGLVNFAFNLIYTSCKL
jgi:hypothetical protein